MVSSSVIFGAIVIAVLAVDGGLALKCYNCDSSKGINCNFGLLSFTYDTVECKVDTGSSILDSIANVLPSNCVKLVGIGKDGSEYIARSCAPSTGIINSCDIIAKTIQFADSKELQSLDCYTCEGDKCNGAFRVNSGIATLFGLMLACFAFMF